MMFSMTFVPPRDKRNAVIGLQRSLPAAVAAIAAEVADQLEPFGSCEMPFGFSTAGAIAMILRP